MNILLTGSGGFIGLHLKQYLGAKYNLFTPRSKDLNLLDESAVDNFFHQNKIDFIIHSAAAGVRITPDAKKEDKKKGNKTTSTKIRYSIFLL